MSTLNDFVSAATAQLELLFEPGDWVELRCIDLTPSPNAQIAHRWFQIGDDDGTEKAIAWAHGLNSSDEAPWNVYFSANPRRRRGGTNADDVALARSLFVDFDGGTTVEAALDRVTKAGLPDPTLAIESGGGCHFWWRLDEPTTDLVGWQSTEDATIKALRGDDTVKGIPQVMRLAGSRNVKPGRGDFLVKMRDPSLRRCPIAAFPRKVHRPMPAVTMQRPAGELADVSRAFLHRGELPAKGGRRGALFMIACDLHARGWDEADAQAAIMGQLAKHPNGLAANDIADIPRQIGRAFSDIRTPGYCSAPVIGCTDEETVEATLAVAIPAPAVKPAVPDRVAGLTWERAGRPDGMLARVSLSRDGLLVDLAEINLGDRDKREHYAVRAADLLGASVTVAAVKAELLRAAAARAAPVVEAQADEPASDAASVSTRWREQVDEQLVATGFPVIDRRFGGGLSPGITAVCAQPGRGKSAFAAQLMLGALNADPDLRAVWFRGEMTDFLLWSRFLATWSAIRSPAVPAITRRMASKRDATAQKVDADLVRVVGGRLNIVPGPLTPERITAAIEKHRPGMVVLDYLQKTRAPGFQDRRLETDYVLGVVHDLTMAHNIATIVISSMAGTRSSASDIGSLTKESNQLDYDAHTYMALWSDKSDSDKDPRPVRLEITKGRTGGEGTVDLWFSGSSQCLRPQADEQLEPAPQAAYNADFDAWPMEARA